MSVYVWMHGCMDAWMHICLSVDVLLFVYVSMITASARISTYMSISVNTFGRFLGESNSEYYYLDALHIYS